ncbi:MAG: hypothetical protein H6Q89_2099 [Myxococcaceae bacterium]|nr:hypothetical protein [Myxococcaceae bacterium]
MGRDHEPTQAEPTFVVRVAKPRRAPAATRGFAERLALFVGGVDRANTEELLCGLTGATLKRATAFSQDARKWDSATRQGRLAVAFGHHPNATERLKRLIAGASPVMRLAIFRQLAPWEQSLFPSLQGQAEGAIAPAMEELAARLIREATR